MNFIDTFTLPEGDKELKDLLNFNPWLKNYTKNQPESGRDPNETDRGGWRGYNRVYSKYISHLKDKKINLLEIGVHSGYGILAWLRYFKNASIYGVEKDLSFTKTYNEHLINYDEFLRASLFFFDSTTSRGWLDLITTFDVIIDDGSHLPADQIRTLRQGWKFLKPGGYYFIEDISSRYYNPACEEVFKEISAIERVGHEVTVYSHFNEGWASYLSNKEVWKKYGITEDTPKDATDYIAVLRKHPNTKME